MYAPSECQILTSTPVHIQRCQGLEDHQFKEGASTVSGVLYMAGREHLELLEAAYSTFSMTNPMHANLFPAVRRMEVEVVRMTASILGGGWR